MPVPVQNSTIVKIDVISVVIYKHNMYVCMFVPNSSAMSRMWRNINF